MRFGLALPQYDFSLPGISRIEWGRVKDHAQHAEELGYDSLWLSDHLFLDISKYGGPEDPSSAMECWTTLAALASITSSVRLGTLVVCNDLRHPALVAKMAATVDVISSGRLELGMGAGWYEPEYLAAGIPFDPPGVRSSRLAEAVQVVGGMLSEEAYSFSGEFYEVKEAYNLPRPVQKPRPPLWVGGKGDRLVKVAAAHADGFNSVWAWTPDDFAGRIEVLEAQAKRAGRSPQDLRRSVGLYALSADDDDELEVRWKNYVEAGPPGVADEGFRRWRTDKLAGTPDEVIARVRGFERLGVSEVILGFGVLPFQIADQTAVEHFAREVLPAFHREER